MDVATDQKPAEPLLALCGISKRFTGVRALDRVDLDVHAGELHVLFGENGAGKSTLINVVSGTFPPDEGTFHFGGEEIRHLTPQRARAIGISPVFQEFSLVPSLTVEENLFLGREVTRGGVMHAREMRKRATALIDELGFDLNPSQRVDDLSRAHQQMAEIAKALLGRVRLLILDEPTASLTERETGRLFELIARLKSQNVGLIYVSHRMREIRALADRVTVLRDGVGQGTFAAAAVSEDALVALMIGRPLTVAFPERDPLPEQAGVVLELSGLQGERFGPVDLVVRKGEILGIAGAEGNGQVPFLRALAGIEPATGGASCGGVQFDRRSPAGPLRAGVVLLSGDRRGEALFPVLSVRANATIQVLRRLGRGGIVPRRAERSAIASLVQRLRVRMASTEQPIQSLSGGNQQKVSLIRPFLRGDVKVILAEEPTQGVDVGARFDIYEALRAKADEGVATVVKSSDPIELAGICDRVVVMSRGRIVQEIPRHELGERRIVEAIVGSRASVANKTAEASAP